MAQDVSARLFAATAQARLEAQLHDVHRQRANASLISSSSLISMDLATEKRNDFIASLRIDELSLEQRENKTSFVWALGVKMKQEKAKWSPLINNSAIEALIKDEKALRDEDTYLKELLLLDKVAHKVHVKSQRERLEEEAKRVKHVLGCKKQTEQNEKLRQCEIRLESLQLKDDLTRRLRRVPPPQLHDTPSPFKAKDTELAVNDKQDQPPLLEVKTESLNENDKVNATDADERRLMETMKQQGVIASELEARLWINEELRRNREAAEKQELLERRRKEENMASELSVAANRLCKGTFRWINGKYGFYDNAVVPENVLNSSTEALSWWQCAEEGSGAIYYYNEITQVSQYEYPIDAISIKLFS